MTVTVVIDEVFLVEYKCQECSDALVYGHSMYTVFVDEVSKHAGRKLCGLCAMLEVKKRNDRLPEIGDVVLAHGDLGSPALGVVVDGGCATPADLLVAVKGQDDLYDFSYGEAVYIRPSMLAPISLYNDEEGAPIHEYLRSL